MSTTVAITGADGFIGSHLAEILVGSGYRVRAMVQYNSFGSWGWLETLDAKTMAAIEVVPGDVRDRDSVLALMAGADMVCHLAALIAIPYSYQAPWSYLETNAGGTLNVLEAGRALGTSRIVCTSTSEVYGSAQVVPITEDHPLQAQSPYSASKIAADKLAESYHLSFDLPIITLRPFNTYGPRQSARAVIPTVISQLATGRREIALGSLTPTRDFNFVLDTALAFQAMLEAPLEDVVGRTFNAGSGVEISVADTVKLIAELMGTTVDIRVEGERLRPERSEVTRLVSDSAAIQRAASWKPAHSLAEGLHSTIEWFCDPDNLSRYKTDQYNV
ncbi:MAG TPA: GDP-mannose 4,6-dehydratase [Acidimicrobiales bacterium]|jgi:UDP-glucose 4-epimerase|nr:GDP-mannose 4,6-dehydratase [Acidimicrobiales bacterium]